MIWNLEWEAGAEEGLKRLPSWQAAARVCRAMMDFAETGRGDVRRVGNGQEFRLHVGTYVVRFGYGRAYADAQRVDGVPKRIRLHAIVVAVQGSSTAASR